METQIKKRKGKWSFHLWKAPKEKTFLKVDLKNFRSALYMYNAEQPIEGKIEYDYMDMPGNKVKVWRTN